MTTLGVGELYDALSAFETPRRGEGPYPIHKRLRFEADRHDDIYDWVADRVALRRSDRVLDVGCGVGYGTIRLAERGAARVTGITISERECALARRAASDSRRAYDIEVRLCSFDRLPDEEFDVVVAIECLKHSADLGVTLGGISGALAPGGRLVIVEDVLVGDAGDPSARRLASDWILSHLYREEDYLAAVGGGAWQVADLTEAVRYSGRLGLAAKLAALNVALRCRPGPTHEAVLRAFRGGLHLEKLYASGAMRYLALVLTRCEGDRG